MSRQNSTDYTKDVNYIELSDKIKFEYSTGGIYKLTVILLEHYNYLKMISGSAMEFKLNHRICKINNESMKKELANLLNVYEYEEVDDKKYLKEYFTSDKLEQTIFLKEKIDDALESIRISSKFRKDQEIYDLRYYIAIHNLIAVEKETINQISQRFYVPFRKAVKEKENTIIQIALFMFPPIENRIIKNLNDLSPDFLEIYLNL